MYWVHIIRIIIIFVILKLIFFHYCIHRKYFKRNTIIGKILLYIGKICSKTKQKTTLEIFPMKCQYWINVVCTLKILAMPMIFQSYRSFSFALEIILKKSQWYVNIAEILALCWKYLQWYLNIAEILTLVLEILGRNIYYQYG